ncbi:Malonyl CoA-acyl carrier protein transacylase [Planctomycetes bacterium Pan216]|uniref:Malonyl CoA-acyl carrier protein transacylase n=1 Tax=Kolteria novifilia TaxID=2527975 RepID=A0A518BC37_9BACT|nr:Malonyl CoA-acyl carrier protein transacylase [Planctomycetes bacterium Pan216]
MATIAFLFPGQGAQSVGMAREVVEKVPAARELFERAADILGYDLLSLCTEGPAERLDATDVSQPALFVAGLAALEQLKVDEPSLVDQCAGAAGLSLGEYTALVFAGAMSFDDGLRVVKVRGESMQAAAEASPTGMVSILGLDAEKLEQVCEQASSVGPIRIANHLCPGNLVVSGAKEACAEASRLATDAGAMKAIPLAVAGAFHTDYMKPAMGPLSQALDGVDLQPPRIPVISNVDAQAHSDPAEIRSILVRQVTEPVLWERSMRALLEQGYDTFYELGPGRVLAGLMKRIQRRTAFHNVTV